LTPEPQEPPLATAILKATLSGQTFELPSLETQLPELYVTEPVILAEANTMITTQNPPTVPSPSNRTSLLGSSPKPFDGDRNNAKEFMHSYIRWWKLNDEKTAFSIPYKQVALCLSYIHSCKVED